jgi:predicted nuclease of restriction endonuclease-like (RecB) superfamily
MIKKLITIRANYLLNELDEIVSAYAERVVNAQNELSPIKQAMATSMPPKDMKRISSIIDQLGLMQGIFKEKE